jgi:transposase
MAKADGFEIMKGHVEINEAYVGGYRPGGPPGRGTNKTTVLGLVERGGRIVAQAIPDVSTKTLRAIVHKNIERGSAVSTDEFSAYSLLRRDGYDHHGVNHSKKQWRKYNYRRGEYHHTNSVEGFWRLFKNSVRSTHIHVSEKDMDRYLKEFTFRSNHRQMTNAMFDLLISAV